METIDCIRSRRSVRKFKDKDVDMHTLGEVLECGLTAPSSGNLQNWRFVVVKSPGTKQAIADACMQQLWIASAPVVVVVCAECEKIKKFYGLRGERLYTIQNCAASVQNMLLAAHSLGLSSCWIGAFEEEMLQRAVGMPPNIRPQAVLPIGYPAETPKKPLHHNMENMIYIESYGNRFSDAAVELMQYYHVALARGVAKTKEIVKAIFEKLKGKE